MKRLLFWFLALAGSALLFSLAQRNARQARWQAMSQHCAGSLQQLGLAAGKWAKEHQNVLPANLASLTNHLGSPVALLCPADGRKIYEANRESWRGFDFNSASYQFVTPGQSVSQLGTQAVFRCRVHQHACDVAGKVALQPLRPGPKNLVVYQ